MAKTRPETSKTPAFVRLERTPKLIMPVTKTLSALVVPTMNRPVDVISTRLR